MPTEITFDADTMLKQLAEVQQNFANLPQDTSTTFVEWQREDMHRKYPKVDGDGLSVSTEIFPRSQLVRPKSPTARKSIRRRAAVAVGRPHAGSHRPILRPELFDMLTVRMCDMIKRAMTWL